MSLAQYIMILLFTMIVRLRTLAMHETKTTKSEQLLDVCLIVLLVHTKKSERYAYIVHKVLIFASFIASIPNY